MGTLRKVDEELSQQLKKKPDDLTRPPLRNTLQLAATPQVSEDEDDSPVPKASPRARRKKIESCKQQDQLESENDSSGDPQWDSILQYAKYIGCAVVVIIVALLLTKFVFKSSDLENENMMTRTVFDKFEGLLKQFPDKFPRQGNRSWNKIKSVVKAITTSSKPRSPGVITLLAVDETESIAHCMGRVVAQGVQLAYNDVAFVHIQGSEFYKKDSDTVKFHIDSKIKEGLQRGKHVVLVEGLHYLPPSSSLLFHGLCDNENAPFKESVFIFTSKVNEIAANEADQEITKIWKNDISDDQRASLESRIGNTIVIVKPEVEKSFATHCPG